MTFRTIILVIGTDGSGKSTLCENLLAVLPEPKAYVYFGLREAVIPCLRKRYAKLGDKGLLVRLLLFPIDYMLRRQQLPDRGFVLLDRVPGWGLVSPNSVIRWIYGRVLPDGDIIILCHGSPEIIVSRKPERSVESCRADLAKWRHVFDSYPAQRKLMLDTTKLDAKTTTLKAVEFILERTKAL